MGVFCEKKKGGGAEGVTGIVSWFFRERGQRRYIGVIYTLVFFLAFKGYHTIEYK